MNDPTIPLHLTPREFLLVQTLATVAIGFAEATPEKRMMALTRAIHNIGAFVSHEWGAKVMDDLLSKITELNKVNMMTMSQTLRDLGGSGLITEITIGPEGVAVNREDLPTGGYDA